MFYSDIFRSAVPCCSIPGGETGRSRVTGLAQLYRSHRRTKSRYVPTRTLLPMGKCKGKWNNFIEYFLSSTVNTCTLGLTWYMYACYLKVGKPRWSIVVVLWQIMDISLSYFMLYIRLLQGAVVGFLVALAFNMWVAIGTFINRPYSATLPTCTHGCNTTYNNDTMDGFCRPPSPDNGYYDMCPLSYLPSNSSTVSMVIDPTVNGPPTPPPL